MANEKFTQLPTVGSSTLADIIAAVQAGTSVQQTLGQVLTLIQANVIQSFAGNPNGNVGGTTYGLCWDITNHILYTCTTSGNAATAVWTSSNSGMFPVSLANGGTNANLTASNGGLFYSTATAGAILSGTATALQIPLSGANSAPAWSTMTYLATIGINEIPYASSANVLGVISAANSSVLISSAGGVPSMSQTLPSAVQTNITALGAQDQALNMNSHLINNVTDPVSDQDAATKKYVLDTAQGRLYKDPCVAATTADFSATYNNGSSGVGATLTGTVMAADAPDGVTIAVGDRVLFKNQASTFQNGIYTATVLGTGAVLPVYTRAVDMDIAGEFKGGTTFIQSGTVNSGLTFTETATVVTVGTDPVTFVQTGAGAAGTVTSVTFTGDGTVLSNTPSSAVTTSGTLVATLNTQSAKTFLAGPTSGGAVTPTFRLLAGSDMPLAYAYITNGGAAAISGSSNLVTSVNRTGNGVVEITFSTNAPNFWVPIVNGGGSATITSWSATNGAVSTVTTYNVAGVATDINFGFIAVPT